MSLDMNETPGVSVRELLEMAPVDEGVREALRGIEERRFPVRYRRQIDLLLIVAVLGGEMREKMRGEMPGEMRREMNRESQRTQR